MAGHRVLMHCNAGPGFGMGHLMRCIALAEEALARGWHVRLEGDVDDRARGVLRRFVPLVEADSWTVKDAAARIRESCASWRPDVVHMDSYWVDANALTVGGALLSNMQDGTYGLARADLAIDGNLGAETRVPRTPMSTSYLLGVDAALVRRQALVHRRAPRPPAATSAKVLIVLGGTDELRLTSKMVAALERLKDELSMTVVTPANQQDELGSLAESSHQHIELVDFVDDLPCLAAAHHLVVSAAGTSVWDFASMGVPMALICVAANQRAGYEAVISAGLAVGLGHLPHDSVARAAEKVSHVLSDRAAMARLGQRGLTTVDGLGSWRVVSAWEQLLRRDAREQRPLSSQVRARPATLDDARLLHAWRNDADTRAVSKTSEEISWEDHLRWFQSTLDRDDRHLLVAEENGQPVGTVRWDALPSGDFEVSISLAPHAKGRGLGGHVLRVGEAAMAAEKVVRLIAVIHQANTPSIQLFKKAGYLPHQPPDQQGFATFSNWIIPGVHQVRQRK